MFHTFITWFVANLLHPILLLVMIGYNDGDLFSSDVIILIVPVFFYSLLFSLPSLIIAWILIALIKRLPIDLPFKFTVWLFLIAAVPAINFVLFGLLLGITGLSKEDIQIFIPATIAVVATVLLRYKYFIRLFNQPQIENHESNLV